MAEANIWKDLSAEEVREFVQWALDNWKPNTEANKVWHPVTRRTWSQLDESFAIAKKQILADVDEKTPEEISAAHLRFISYPNNEKTWPVWILSESDIKGVAKQLGSDIEGLDPDLIVHYFKKGFMPLVDSWDEVLKEAIKQARARVEKTLNE